MKVIQYFLNILGFGPAEDTTGHDLVGFGEYCDRPYYYKPGSMNRYDYEKDFGDPNFQIKGCKPGFRYKQDLRNRDFGSSLKDTSSSSKNCNVPLGKSIKMKSNQRLLKTDSPNVTENSKLSIFVKYWPRIIKKFEEMKNSQMFSDVNKFFITYKTSIISIIGISFAIYLLYLYRKSVSKGEKTSATGYLFIAIVLILAIFNIETSLDLIKKWVEICLSSLAFE